MLITIGIPNKIFLFAGIISAVYFGILFSNVLQHVDFVLIGVLIELCTIPMILIQFCMIGYILYLTFIKKLKPSIEVVIGFVIALAIASYVVYSFMVR
ncbi:hypothetical protein [Pedobacter frigoris]|uniref:Uncharacterized protein n=1 Tax=Pedobacter frigoris TaxID=2571272 RepID=A0A4U1CGI9_9SPHI|nr:hypothetical protein [Pedobacter frigoris]TKC06332.1 hypothetical protein FA047_13555 [Pedobacter frigoris]